MSHLRGTNRAEVKMLPPSLDDYVAAESAVRFIEACAESLDIFRPRASRAASSRPRGVRPAIPADLLKPRV